MRLSSTSGGTASSANRLRQARWYAKRDRGGGAEHLLSIESEPSPGVVSLARCIEQQRKLKAIAVVEGAWYAMPSVSVQGEALGRMLVYQQGRSSPTQQGWWPMSRLGCGSASSNPWFFAGGCRTTRSRGRAEKRRRALLASRRRAP